MKKHCQNCAHARINRTDLDEMPTIICTNTDEVGWDRVRAWGFVCEKWKIKGGKVMPKEIDCEQSLEWACEFVRNSDYKSAATHQDDNPLNVHDCAMILLEYIERNCDGHIKKGK